MKPLILDYAVSRTGELKVIYSYDSKQALNTIFINNEKKPFILSGREEISLLTKTKVLQESDDDYLSAELLTKTEVYQEQDDDPGILLELQTKTLTHSERDDEGPSYIQ